MTSLHIDLQGDPGQSMLATAHIGTDELHIPIDLKLPPGKVPEMMAGVPPVTIHYGIHEISEFPIDDAGKSEQLSVITGVPGGFGAGNGAKQIAGIAAISSP